MLSGRFTTLPGRVHLVVDGNGRLPYAGGYRLDDVDALTHDSYEDAYRWSCPFEGVIDAAFQGCAVVEAGTKAATYAAAYAPHPDDWAEGA